MTKPPFASLGQKALDEFRLGARRVRSRQARAGRTVIKRPRIVLLPAF